MRDSDLKQGLCFDDGVLFRKCVERLNEQTSRTRFHMDKTQWASGNAVQERNNEGVLRILDKVKNQEITRKWRPSQFGLSEDDCARKFGPKGF